MVILGLAACISMQCFAVKDDKTDYKSVQNCETIQAQMFDKFPVPDGMHLKTICIDWDGPTDLVMPFIRFKLYDRPKVDA